MSRHLRLALCLLALGACSGTDRGVVLHGADAIPDVLSAWGVLAIRGNALAPVEGVHVYELNTPLFSDYAQKLRTVWVPDGQTINYRVEDVLDFPVGTIISKTFYYAAAEGEDGVVRADRGSTLTDRGIDLDSHRVIETRLLVRYDTGWQAFPYVWNAEQTEATLEIAGDIRPLTLVDAESTESISYVVPDVNQCAGCHTPDHSAGDLRPLGPQAWQLNRDDLLTRWADMGLLTGLQDALPTGPRWSDRDDLPVDEVARAYLDANCAHCHNPAGPADTSALHLNREAPLDRHVGICKSPVAVGRGSGDRPYDITPGDPDQSIMVYRMQHSDPAIAMPELGRSSVHTEGVALISAWIQGLEGQC